MELDFVWIRKYDALFLIERSPGADREVAFAEARGMTIYRSMDEVPEIMRVACPCPV